MQELNQLDQIKFNTIKAYIEGRNYDDYPIIRVNDKGYNIAFMRSLGRNNNVAIMSFPIDSYFLVDAVMRLLDMREPYDINYESQIAYNSFISTQEAYYEAI